MFDWLAWGIGTLLGMLVGILISYLWNLRQIGRKQEEVIRLETSLEDVKAQLSRTDESLKDEKVGNLDLQEKIIDLNRLVSRQESEIAHAKEQLIVQAQSQEAQEARLRVEFENLTTQILEKNTQKLSHDNQASMQHLLQPLKERISQFEKRVEDTYQQEARERFNLQKEIGKLVELNHQMSVEAQNLTKALKGDAKAQGNWGEMVLARILESSGLREGEEFIVQGKEMALHSSEGKRLQPDVIIQLPEGKHLIIDAKVSLTAYERHASEELPEQKTLALKQHIDSVTTHIHQLSGKHYSSIKSLNAPDFVLMFLPVEPAFHLAIQQKKDLFAFAWERRIVLVSPSTLLATLKTVASLWSMEHQNQNAQEIARQGGALFDKFVGFIDEMEKVGKSLDRASNSYHDAMNKLKNGKGNLTSRAEKLRELGVKNSKQLPS